MAEKSTQRPLVRGDKPLAPKGTQGTWDELGLHPSQIVSFIMLGHIKRIARDGRGVSTYEVLV